MIGNALRSCRAMWIASWGRDIDGDSPESRGRCPEFRSLTVPCPSCHEVIPIVERHCLECEERHVTLCRHPHDYRRSHLVGAAIKAKFPLAKQRTKASAVDHHSTVIRSNSVQRTTTAQHRRVRIRSEHRHSRDEGATNVLRRGPFVHLIDDSSSGPYSADVYQFLTASGPVLPPRQIDLDHILEATIRIRILAGGSVEGRSLCNEELAEVHDPVSIRGLKQCLRLNDDSTSSFCCSCLGGPTVQLIDRQGRVTHMTLHHEHAIRLQGWDADAILARPKQLTNWLTTVGVDPELLDSLYKNRYRHDLPLSAAGSRDESRAQKLIRQAVEYEMQGEYGVAHQVLEEALLIRPDFAFGYALRAQLRFREGAIDAAIEDCCEATRMGLETVDIYMIRAACYASLGKPELSLLDLDRAIELNPYSAIARNSRGLMHAELCLFDQAIQDSRHAAELIPNWPLAHFNLAFAYYLFDDLHASLSSLNRAIELDGTLIEAFMCRGHVLCLLGRYEKSLADYSRVIELDPGCGEARIGRAEAYLNLGAEEKAVEDYETAADLLPDRSDELLTQTAVMLCQRCLDAGDIQRAEQTIDEALSVWGDIPELLECRANVSWYIGRLSDALEEFGEVIRAIGPVQQVLSGRGQVFAEARRFEEARNDLIEAVRLARLDNDHKSLAYALNGCGFALGGLGYFEDSLNCFEESLMLEPENAWAYHNRAIIYHKMGYLDRCLADFRRCLEARRPAILPRMKQRALALLEEHGQRVD